MRSAAGVSSFIVFAAVTLALAVSYLLSRIGF